ncbi:MFS transporter [Sphingomonas spermidinifaciens]|uniref:MFS transporter n=1 Tax=Sphingomonas spermidinifaciens TaxID=1141889 RepID=A0A2A4B9G9_9SPHN|nr:MFS transporter [Sphingomonas spermidinifaciens]PCD04306.1 MFS transporter [Sphingomonas spermidinifaciens]
MPSDDPSTVTPSTAAPFLRGRRAALLLGSLFLVSVFAQVDRILPFILAEAIKAELALSDTQIGLVTGLAFAACYALLSLPMARLCDHGSPRLVLLACTLTWSVMTALGGLATGFASLAASRFGVALGEAGAVPSSHSIIARRIGPTRRGIALGIFSTGIPIGTMVGFGLGGAIGEQYGWRAALVAAGLFGAVVGILAAIAAGPTPPIRRAASDASFWQESRALLAIPAFRALLVVAVCIGFAATPFYAFAATFLIRAHGFSTTQAGVAFGLSQGLLGAIGTLAGGRRFDASVRAGRAALLRAPMIAFAVAGLCTAAALFVADARLCVALMMPAMFAFAFMLPFAFGAAHRVAGVGREGMASSLAMIASGLVGPALGPLIVGVLSDGAAAAAAGARNGLAFGLLVVPAACAATVIACRIANRRMATAPPRSILDDGPPDLVTASTLRAG